MTYDANMIGLSTVYLVNSSGTWAELTRKAAKLGYKNFELNVDIPSSWLDSIKKSVQIGDSRILSVHNFCPKVEKVPKGRTIFSPYLVTSEDENERKTAVELTKKTIDIALELNASAVVVHLGEVVTKLSGIDLGKYVQEFGVKAKLYQSHIEELRKNRAATSERYLINAIKSLKEIVPHAEAKNIRIGLENRFFYHEIPLLDEFGVIFSEIKSANLGLWYDVGHAEIFIRMGFMESHEQLLKAYKNKIIGFHLHDIKVLRDHYAPGEGEMEFKQFFPYIGPKTLKIIEAHPYSAPSSVREAANIFRLVE